MAFQEVNNNFAFGDEMPLFIGGPMDGQQVEMEQTPFIDVAVNQELEFEPVPGGTMRYKLELICTDNRDYRVYCPEGFTCEDVMSSLINGYKHF